MQKLHGTLIVTWQANRIDTPSSRIHAAAPCPWGPSSAVVIIRFLSGESKIPTYIYRDRVREQQMHLVRGTNYRRRPLITYLRSRSATIMRAPARFINRRMDN